MEDPLKLCADLNAIFRRQSGGWLDRDTLRRDARVDVLREQVLLSLERVEHRSRA